MHCAISHFWSTLNQPNASFLNIFRILDNWIDGLFVNYEGKYCIRKKM